MLDERHHMGSLPLVVTSMDRLDIVLGLLASQVRISYYYTMGMNMKKMTCTCTDFISGRA